MDRLRSFLRRGASTSNAPEGSSGALPVLAGLIVAGFIGIFIYALTSTTGFATTASVGSMVAGGALVLGASIGFLFGLPRTLVGARLPIRNEPADPGRRSDRFPDFQQNTNLEEISDWLTKILVGVGLTQLSGISQALNQAATAIQDGLGSPPQNYVFSLAILIYFPVCGFLTGYLWTRLNLANALTRAEMERRVLDETTKTEENTLILAAQVAKENAEVQDTLVPLLVQSVNENAEVPAIATVQQVDPNKASKKAGLWVDDNPRNNASLEQSFETLLNIDIDQSLSTEDAVQRLTLKPGKYSFVISDIGRPPDLEAGFDLLSKIQDLNGPKPKFYIYSTRARTPAVRERALSGKADGVACSPQELFQFLRSALA